MDAKYSAYYSAIKLKDKLFMIIKRIGKTALEQVLTLFILLKSDHVPKTAKVMIVAVLGYLIFPFDFVPDFLPGGLLDDLAAISILLAQLAIYRTEQVRAEVEEMMNEFCM